MCTSRQKEQLANKLKITFYSRLKPGISHRHTDNFISSALNSGVSIGDSFNQREDQRFWRMPYFWNEWRREAEKLRFDWKAYSAIL